MIYAPFTGDWGEAIGRVATFQFFDAFDIDYRQVWRKDLASAVTEGVGGHAVRDLTLVVAGGSAWAADRPIAREVVEAYAPRFGATVVLPTTFELSLPDVDADVTCAGSDLTVSPASVADVVACHDMAFFLDVELDAPVPGDVGHGYFREDGRHAPQRTGAVIGDGSFDVCALRTLVDDVTPMLKILTSSTRLRTDRLEVAVAGALMGVEVDLYAAADGRNRAVFDHSLAPFFGLASWRTWPTVAEPEVS